MSSLLQPIGFFAFMAVVAGCGNGRAPEPQAATERTGAAARCDSFAWDAPRVLRTAAGNRVYVDQAQLVPRDSGMLLIGAWGLEMDERGAIIPATGPGADASHYTAGVEVHANGIARRLVMPDTFTQLHAPRAAREHTGDVTVVWAATNPVGGPVSELRTATLSRNAWTPVRTIAPRIAMDWSMVTPSDLLVEAERLSVVAGASLHEASGAVLLRRDDPTWRTIPLATPHMTYVRYVPVRADTFALAFVAAAAPHGNTLFVQRVTADGVVLDDSLRISVPDDGPVFDPVLMRTRSGALLLGWASSTGASLIFDRFMLATSHDGGLTWTRLPSARVGEGFDAPSVAVDSAGLVHMAVRVDPAGTPHPGHLAWTGAEWRRFRVRSFARGSNEGRPLMYIDGQNRPRVIWAVFEREGVGSRSPYFVWSSASRMCS